MSDSRLVPNIRFKKFEIQWSKYKFADMLDKNNGIRRGPFGSSLRKDSFVKKGDYVVYEQQNAIYNMYKTRYNINKSKFEELKKFELQPGDFIMSGAGTIGKISEVPEGITPGIFNQALIRFKINKKTTSRTFFLTFMRSYTMQRKLTEKNPGSAISNLVSMKEVKNFSVVIPDKQEQQKIGNFFAKLDKLLDLQQQKIDKLELLKKTLLQKLFPKHDAKIPELRFKGFGGDWNEKRLNSITKRLDNYRKPITANKRLSGQTPYYGANGIQDYVKGYTHEGEFVLIAEDGANDVRNYPVRFVKGYIWVNNHAHVLQAKVGTSNNLFLAYSLKNRNLLPYLVGSGRMKLNADVLMNLLLKIPDLNEQQKIGNLLSKVDQLIELENKKLQNFQQVKKCLLQNMFVE